MPFKYGNRPSKQSKGSEGDQGAAAPGDQYPDGQPNYKTKAASSSKLAKGTAGAKGSDKSYSGSSGNHSPKGGKGY